ncbi:MAG: MFS transporter [Alphaproteobacteria bacterium]|nr:MFS transporter [Alphaproteobacteria bacterium]
MVGEEGRERPPGKQGIRAIPGGVWALGFVSLLMDVSSEMIHSLLPLFLVTQMGVGALAVGLIEGVAEATASIVKIFSGALSDRLGKRKLLALAGYGLAALTKPIFPLAATAGWVFFARFTDRIGKGIRGAPRDALVADLTPPELRGAAYGLRQALDTIGAFAGPLLAIVLMIAFAGDMRAVFWIAAIPAFAAVLVLALAVRDPPLNPDRAIRRNPLRMEAMRNLGRDFWILVLVAGFLMLPRFSEAFLLLRGGEGALTLAFVPLVLVAMNAAYSLTAYPAGRLSDRMGRRGLLAGGYVVLMLADILLALAGGAAAVLGGAVLWGIHMGMTQGILAALVADTAPADTRGTAFGVFHMVGGICLLLASVIAGALWQAIGPGATFGVGAVAAALCIPAIMLLPRGR